MGFTQKKGNRYYYVMDVPTATGKRKQQWKGSFVTEKEADKALHDAEYEVQHGIYRNFGKMTVRELLLEWLKTSEEIRGLESTTINSYRILIEKHINPILGNVKLKNLNALQINALYSKKLEGDKENKPLSPTYVNYVHRVLKMALKDAKRKGVIMINPAELADAPRKSGFKGKDLNPAEIKDLLTAMKDTLIYTPVLLAVALGLRRGEVLGLRWGDINFEEGFLTINQTIVHPEKGWVIKNPKTISSIRILPLSKTILDALKMEKERQSFIRRPYLENFKKYDLVVCRKDGTPIYPTYMSEAFKKTLKDKQLPAIRFHDLRHTMSTVMARKKINPSVASSILGHSGIGAMLDLYTHTDFEMKRDAMQEIESVFTA